jgi:hypothetical protein
MEDYQQALLERDAVSQDASDGVVEDDATEL